MDVILRKNVDLHYEFFNNFESEHTKKSYRSDIKQFLDFLFDNTPEVDNISKIVRIHIIAFKRWLKENDFAPKTINRKLSSLSSYFDFLVEKGIFESNPVTSIKRPKQEVISPTNDLSDKQISQLLHSPDPKSSSFHLHQAVLYLLFSTGIRKSELINLKFKDFLEIDGVRCIEVRAKGGKHLLKALHPSCFEVLLNYIIHLKSNTSEDELTPNDWFFRPTKNPTEPGFLNRPLRASSIDYIIKKYCKKVGITERITPHSARASYIGAALEQGTDLWKVAADVGHSSINTTQSYNKRRQQIKDSPALNLNFFELKDN